MESKRRLFDLSRYGQSFDGLYFDEDLFLWRRERHVSGPTFRRLADQEKWPTSHKDLGMDFVRLRGFVSRSRDFGEFKKECKEEDARQKDSIKGKFVVGVITSNDTVTFSPYSRTFETMEQAQAAVAHVMQSSEQNSVATYAVFECKAIANLSAVTWM